MANPIIDVSLYFSKTSPYQIWIRSSGKDPAAYFPFRLEGFKAWPNDPNTLYRSFERETEFAAWAKKILKAVANLENKRLRLMIPTEDDQIVFSDFQVR